MKCRKKCCLYPAITILPGSCLSGSEKGEENRRFVTVLLFLMWSEIISVFNLQTSKSIFNSAQKCAIVTFEIQKFSGVLPLCPLNSPPLSNTPGSATATGLNAP